MTFIYLAVACLIVAQVVGIYGLKTRKADVIFAVLMVALLGLGLALGILGVYHQVK